MTRKSGGKLGATERKDLMDTLRTRFEANEGRHRGMRWSDVEKRLEDRPDALRTLHAMEQSGGEPDVIGREKKGGAILFADCAKQSPAGRRSLCYDQEALDARKKNKPDGSALEQAQAMGATLLDEEQYRRLQELEELDTTTSSWLLTPADVRERGGAIFGDCRYGRVFIYHNGAESYYAARGFRCLLEV